MVDKINTISKFKGYVRSALLSQHTSSKSSTPLLNSHINSRLLKAAPDFNQPLLQFIDGVNFRLVITTLHHSPDLIVNWIDNWIEIWTVWRPQVWKMKSGVSRRRSCRVSNANDVILTSLSNTQEDSKYQQLNYSRNNFWFGQCKNY